LSSRSSVSLSPLPAEALLSDSQVEMMHEYLRERGLFAFLKRFMAGYHEETGVGAEEREREKLSVEVVLMAFGVRVVRLNPVLLLCFTNRQPNAFDN
jgi:hypothetical protein